MIGWDVAVLIVVVGLAAGFVAGVLAVLFGVRNEPAPAALRPPPDTAALSDEEFWQAMPHAEPGGLS